MRRALIFGGTGGIGQAATKAFETQGIQTLAIGRRYVNLYAQSTYDLNLIDEILGEEDPDIVVFAAGVISDEYKHLNVNFRAAWNIISYYAQNHPVKDVHVLLLGSSTYNHSAPQYPLYAAAKAALVSMAISMMPRFIGTHVFLNVLNPAKTDTPLRSTRATETGLLSPDEVGAAIFKIVNTDVRGHIFTIDKRLPNDHLTCEAAI
jgi:2-C-methyl-D-erythritol 4-phosphate cytidylyltransferase